MNYKLIDILISQMNLYETFSINQIHSIQDLRKTNILLSLLKEM